MDEQLKEATHTRDVAYDVESDYANNVAYEQTVWDLKLIFGEYSDRLKSVEWHTAITVPWAQAKLMLYYLKVNVEAYEADHGKIHVPSSMVPPDSSTIPQDPANPAGTLNLKEIVDRNRKDFLDSLKK